MGTGIAVESWMVNRCHDVSCDLPEEVETRNWKSNFLALGFSKSASLRMGIVESKSTTGLFLGSIGMI